MRFLGDLIISLLMAIVLVAAVVLTMGSIAWAIVNLGPLAAIIPLGLLVFGLLWASAYEHIKRG